MARIANGTGDWLVRSIAVGAVAVIIGIVGWTLVKVLNNSNDNARSISAIEARLERMEADIQRLLNE